MPFNEYYDHTLILYISCICERIWCTLYVNNGNIIFQVDFGFPWFPDYPGISWTFALRSGSPIFHKSVALIIWGQVVVIIWYMLFVESFSRQWKLYLEFKGIWTNTLLEEIPGKWLWFTKNRQDNQLRQKRWCLF